MLTTRDIVKAELHLTNATHDAVIDRIIDTVSLAIAGYCKRSFRGVSMLERQADKVEYPRVLGDKLILRVYPIESISEVRQAADRDFTDPDSIVDSGDYVIDDEREDAIVNLDGSWFTGKRMVRVTYTGGFYTGVSASMPSGAIPIPADLAGAATRQVIHEFKHREQFGEQSITIGDMQIARVTDGLLGIVKEKLAPYINYV